MLVKVAGMEGRWGGNIRTLVRGVDIGGGYSIKILYADNPTTNNFATLSSLIKFKKSFEFKNIRSSGLDASRCRIKV